jgi:branched-chain amino acid transport system ATP-binding protein
VPPLLEVDGVTSGYGKVEVLHDLSIGVPEGTVVALLGPNGAGKTTTLKVISGTLPVWDGEVRCDGERLDGRSAYDIARRGITLVPEGRGIFRDLTVEENLTMFATQRSVKEVVEYSTEFFPALRDRLRQQAGRLSGGQQQMVAVSRALVSDAKVIMADELSVGLAPVIIDEIYEAVAALRTQGKSLMIVEQYVDRALAVVDDIYVLHKGRIVFVGDPKLAREQNVFEAYLGSEVSAAHG